MLHEPWQNYAKLKKSDTKGHIWYDSIHRKYIEYVNPEREMKVDLPGR